MDVGRLQGKLRRRKLRAKRLGILAQEPPLGTCLSTRNKERLLLPCCRRYLLIRREFRYKGASRLIGANGNPPHRHVFNTVGIEVQQECIGRFMSERGYKPRRRDVGRIAIEGIPPEHHGDGGGLAGLPIGQPGAKRHGIACAIAIPMYEVLQDHQVYLVGPAPSALAVSRPLPSGGEQGFGRDDGHRAGAFGLRGRCRDKSQRSGRWHGSISTLIKDVLIAPNHVGEGIRPCAEHCPGEVSDRIQHEHRVGRTREGEAERSRVGKREGWTLRSCATFPGNA